MDGKAEQAGALPQLCSRGAAAPGAVRTLVRKANPYDALVEVATTRLRPSCDDLPLTEGIGVAVRERGHPGAAPGIHPVLMFRALMRADHRQSKGKVGSDNDE